MNQEDCGAFKEISYILKQCESSPQKQTKTSIHNDDQLARRWCLENLLRVLFLLGKSRCGLVTVSFRGFYGAGQHPIDAESFLGERRESWQNGISPCVTSQQNPFFWKPPTRCPGVPPLCAFAAATPGQRCTSGAGF